MRVRGVEVISRARFTPAATVRAEVAEALPPRPSTTVTVMV